MPGRKPARRGSVTVVVATPKPPRGAGPMTPPPFLPSLPVPGAAGGKKSSGSSKKGGKGK